MSEDKQTEATHDNPGAGNTRKLIQGSLATTGVLIALGIPLVGYVTYQNGPWVGLFVLFAGMSILRWPLRYLLRWVRQTAR